MYLEFTKWRFHCCALILALLMSFRSEMSKWIKSQFQPRSRCFYTLFFSHSMKRRHEGQTKLYQFKNCRLLRDSKLIEEDLWVRDGKIIDPRDVFWGGKVLADVQIDCNSLIISPGFIDLQINGKFSFCLHNLKLFCDWDGCSLLQRGLGKWLCFCSILKPITFMLFEGGWVCVCPCGGCIGT